MYIVYIHDQCSPQVIKCPLKRDHFKREGSLPSITIFQRTCEYFFSSLGAPVTTGTGAGTKQPGKTGSILGASVKKGIWGFHIMFDFTNVWFIYTVCLYPIGSVYGIFCYIILVDSYGKWIEGKWYSIHGSYGYMNNIFISLRLMPPAFPGPEIASSMARSTTKSSSSNSSSNNSTILSIASSMARSTTKSNSNSSNNNSNSSNNNSNNNNNNNNSNNNNNNNKKKKKNNKNKNKNKNNSNSNSNKSSSSSSGNSRKPTRTAAPERTQGESSPRPFGCGVVVVLVLVVVVVGGGGGFLGEVKARPKDIISFSLDYNKQKLSTDKQSIIKPHFTRHAGKAGGFSCYENGPLWNYNSGSKMAVGE